MYKSLKMDLLYSSSIYLMMSEETALKGADGLPIW